MSGGKSGSANQSKMVYGSGCVALSWGPWDWLKAIIHNGNYLFQGDLTLSSDVTDLTGALSDPRYLAPGGSVKIYRGTESQPADFTGRRDKGTVKLEFRNLLFGQDTGTAPNLQAIGGGLPRVSTSIVAGADNIADDGQINPVAAFAEILLDERGAGRSLADLDAPSWLASAHWCAQDQAHRDVTFVSPLLDQQMAFRAIAKRLLDPFHGFCRWTKEGKIACRIYEWGSDPGGLPVLDARHFKRRIRIPAGDWEDVKTEIVVAFTDRDYQFQSNTQIVPNAKAADIRQVDDQGQLDRPDVMRGAQAHRQGLEYVRRMGSAPSSATLPLRRPVREDLGLEVGDKIKIDTDPEPGGGGIAQLCRIESIRWDRSDEAKITVITDNLVPAVPYTPGFTPPTPPADDAPPLVYFLGVPLPPASYGLPRAVGFVATRPSAAVVRYGVYFSDTSGGSYDELGTQEGFAVRAQLVSGISAGDTTIQLTELDGLGGPDAGLAANTPGGNATTAANNTLLALICSLDGNGRIALDGNGDPVMEFVSIKDRSFVSGATHDYSVLRGRLGTTAAAWGAGAVAWIIPQVSLFPWRHELFDSLAGSPAFFRLVSETQGAIDDTIPVPECSVNMLPDSSPMLIAGVENIYFDFIFIRSATVPSTPTGNAPAGWSDGPPAGTDPLYMSRGQRRTDTGELLGTWSPPVRIDGLNGDGLEVEYSVDGSSWHSTFTPGDLYMRQRVGGGAWSGAIRIVGETGPAGPAGPSGGTYTLSIQTPWDGVGYIVPSVNGVNGTPDGSGISIFPGLTAGEAANIYVPSTSGGFSFYGWSSDLVTAQLILNPSNNSTAIYMFGNLAISADY